MTAPTKQFLVPLNANSKGAGWDFDRLDDTIRRIRARMHRRGQLGYGFAVKGVYLDTWLSDHLRKAGSLNNIYRVEVTPLVVLKGIWVRCAKVWRKAAPIQADKHLHSGTYPKHRLVSFKETLNDRFLDFKSFRRRRFGTGIIDVPIIGISEPAPNRDQSIKLRQDNVYDVGKIWDTKGQSAGFANAQKIPLRSFVVSSA